MSSSVDVSSAGTVRTACRSSVAVDASRATCGGTSIAQMSWTSMRRSARALDSAISYSRSPVGAGARNGCRSGVGISAYGASVPWSEPVRLSTREYGASSGIAASRASGPDGSSSVTCTPRRAARYPSAPSSVDLPPPGSATKTARPERSRISIGKCRSRKTGRRRRAGGTPDQVAAACRRRSTRPAAAPRPAAWSASGGRSRCWRSARPG